MITGIGVDIVKVGRFKKWIEDPGLAARFFHPDELSVLKKDAASACQSLAVRFAAKEAFGKALGTGLKGLILKDICVKQNPFGKPTLTLFGTARKRFENSGAKNIHISLSHEDEYAVACVVLEGVKEEV